MRGIIIKEKENRTKSKNRGSLGLEPRRWRVNKTKSKNRGSLGLEPRRWRVTRGLDKEWSPIFGEWSPYFGTQRSSKKILKIWNSTIILPSPNFCKKGFPFVLEAFKMNQVPHVFGPTRSVKGVLLLVSQ